MWNEYAPGVESGILTQQMSLDPTVNRKMVVREGSEQYRGGARGLYECGSFTHPGGGIHTACGVNAFSVVAADRVARLDGDDPGGVSGLV